MLPSYKSILEARAFRRSLERLNGRFIIASGYTNAVHITTRLASVIPVAKKSGLSF